MGLHMHVCTRACGGQRLQEWSTALLSKAGSPTRAWRLLGRLSWLARDPLIFTAPALGWRVFATMLSFLHRFWGSNSGPHSWTASALPAKLPSPLPWRSVGQYPAVLVLAVAVPTQARLWTFLTWRSPHTPLFFLYWDKVSCSPGWPWTFCEDDLEPLVLLSFTGLLDNHIQFDFTEVFKFFKFINPTSKLVGEVEAFLGSYSAILIKLLVLKPVMRLIS